MLLASCQDCYPYVLYHATETNAIAFFWYIYSERLLLTNVLIARYTFNAYSVVIVPVIVAFTLLNREHTFYIYTGM